MKIEVNGTLVDLISTQTKVRELKPEIVNGELFDAKEPSGLLGFAADGSAYWRGFRPDTGWEMLRGPLNFADGGEVPAGTYGIVGE